MVTNDNCDTQRLLLSIHYYCSTKSHEEMETYNPLTHIQYWMKNIEKNPRQQGDTTTIS